MLTAQFSATTDPTALANSDAIIICVPTPLAESGEPDLTAVKGAGRLIAENLQRGQLVVLESTTYPGTTDEILKPILEGSGLVAGEDFHLAFSPERVDPGNAKFGIRNTPKVVGGLTQGCLEAATGLYESLVDEVVPAKGTREAEMTKLLENTYRHVNIALVNEMAQVCHALGIDIWNVIQNAATKPFGFQPFYPGPGVGGHCIPIDPNYLSYQVRSTLGYPFQFIELAQAINNGMPDYVVQRLTWILNDESKAMRGSRVLLLGVTYKPDIADQRESPALPLARLLESRGAVLSFHDPLVEKWSLGDRDLERVSDLEDALANADAVLLLQNHSEYDVPKLEKLSRVFFDTRGAATQEGSFSL
jgi:nucleotide sugar dehydrogenase